MIRKARAAAAASLLGLPIALLAHAFVFGGEHAAGGAFSTAALATGAFGLVLAVALHSRSLLQGSVLASRLREQMPSFAALAISGSIWFASLELCETAHSVPLIAIAAAIFAACIILRAAVGAVARSISDIAIVLSNGQHMPVLRETRALLAATTPLTVRSFAHARRLFSRPPPALS